MAYFWFEAAQLHLPDIVFCRAFGKLEFVNMALSLPGTLPKKK